MAVTNLFRNFAHVSGTSGRCGFKQISVATVDFILPWPIFNPLKTKSLCHRETCYLVTLAAQSAM